VLQYTRMERLAKDKHCILLGPFISQTSTRKWPGCKNVVYLAQTISDEEKKV